MNGIFVLGGRANCREDLLMARKTIDMMLARLDGDQYEDEGRDWSEEEEEDDSVSYRPYIVIDDNTVVITDGYYTDIDKAIEVALEEMSDDDIAGMPKGAIGLIVYDEDGNEIDYIEPDYHAETIIGITGLKVPIWREVGD